MSTGKRLLKIASIIMIVAGAIGIITNIIVIAGGGALAALGYSKAALIIIGGIVMLIGSVFELVVGILGTKNAYVAGAGAKYFTLGIVVLAIDVIGFILTAIGSQTNAGAIIVDIIFGFGIPIFFIVACSLAKKED